jgi:hypothetical protein
VVFILLAVSLSFTAQASLTAGRPSRGEGAGFLSGYQVSRLHFLLAEEPGEISQVEFDLDGPADQVQVSFGIREGRSFPCQLISGRHWHCTLAGVETGTVRQIRVSAVGG